MDYEYDVFISYRNISKSADWVHNILHKELEFLLPEALNQEKVNIFMDKSEIHNGDDWANRIKRALVTSRCMVSVLIPSYFHREWCLREFAVMYHRQQKLNYNTLENPTGLILPVHLHDGVHFPKYANAIQGMRFQDYFKPSEPFKKHPKYLEFDDKIKKWSWDIAKSIKQAPPFDEDWLKSEWIDTPYETLKSETLPPHLQTPKL